MASRLLGETARRITPYVPGEQPRDRRYTKLNTNESPFPPSPMVEQALREYAHADLRLYPDPDVRELSADMGRYYGLPPEMVFAGGGSDEVLGYAFLAFSSPGDPVYFPDITYGFYQVYADLFGLESRTLPLADNFTVSTEDYYSLPGNVFLANPNAPTGIALSPEQLEPIIKSNPDRLVVIDEAYVDFAPGMSCIPLTRRYDNLLVVQTFSKSRALAGMRLGFGFGHPDLIEGLNRIKYSFNPYNIDRVSMAVGRAAIEDSTYFTLCRDKIIATREQTADALADMGFEVLPSQANFLFARHAKVGGAVLYQALREQGILVRHFEKPRIRDFLRITIGTDEEMGRLTAALEQRLREE